MEDALKTKLTELGFNDDQIKKLEDQGVSSAADMAMLDEKEIRDVSGCTIITAKKAAAAFAPKPATPPASPDATASIQTILPTLPDDKSFLEMLKVGGTLKIDRVNVIAAMHAAIASDVGLFDLPDILIQKMEAFALEQDEPVGEAFYRLQRQLAERHYGEILSALGTTGSFVSDKRKKDTLGRLKIMLWPALRDFNNQLRQWMEVWTQGTTNLPAMMMALTVGPRGVMPPGVLQPPDSAVLRDAAENVINCINKVFAGTGIPVARALAYDAMRIREVLEDPGLPSTVGAATRDQMLKTLGVEVGSDYVRLEQNVTRYTLAIMELQNVSPGSDELAYLSALYTLGMSIPWDKLGRGAVSVPIPDRTTKRDPAPPIRGDRPDSDLNNVNSRFR